MKTFRVGAAKYCWLLATLFFLVLARLSADDQALKWESGIFVFLALAFFFPGLYYLSKRICVNNRCIVSRSLLGNQKIYFDRISEIRMNSGNNASLLGVTLIDIDRNAIEIDSKINNFAALVKLVVYLAIKYSRVLPRIPNKLLKKIDLDESYARRAEDFLNRIVNRNFSDLVSSPEKA